jgi:hypothetical protein
MCGLHRNFLAARLADRIAPAPDRVDELGAADASASILRSLQMSGVHLREIISFDFVRPCRSARSPRSWNSLVVRSSGLGELRLLEMAA